MAKSKPIQAVKVVVVNPPTKEEAKNQLRKLASHLGKIWKP